MLSRIRTGLSCVLKRGDLRGGFFAAFFLEQHIAGGAGIEGRVQVNQVHARLGYVLSQDSQVVAEIEFVCPIR